MMTVNDNNGTGVEDSGGHRRTWLVSAVLVVAGWLEASPLVLHTTRVTAGLLSAVTGGLLLAGLAGWALGARNRIPPLAIAWFLGLWLLLAPSLWEFGDGRDSDPGLVPISPSDALEPTRAVVARAEWNSVLAGLVILVLAGSALLAGRRRQARPAADAGGNDRLQVGIGGGRR
jgi:hypothetical protein